MVYELVLVHQLLLVYYEVSIETEHKYSGNFIATWPCCDIQLHDNFAAKPNYFKIEFYKKESMMDWNKKKKQKNQKP